MASRSEAGGMLTWRTPSKSRAVLGSRRPYVKAPPTSVARADERLPEPTHSIRLADTRSRSVVRGWIVLVSLPLKRTRFVDETLKEPAYSLAGKRTFICRDNVV